MQHKLVLIVNYCVSLVQVQQEPLMLALLDWEILLFVFSYQRMSLVDTVFFNGNILPEMTGGTDPRTGQSGVGKGVENETFMGCSDIAIVANG